MNEDFTDTQDGDPRCMKPLLYPEFKIDEFKDIGLWAAIFLSLSIYMFCYALIRMIYMLFRPSSINWFNFMYLTMSLIYFMIEVVCIQLMMALPNFMYFRSPNCYSIPIQLLF